jgi:xanthine dehydrogenase accessory factor
VRDVLGEVLARCEAGQSTAVATVVGVSRSAPRRLGAALAVAGDGAVTGGVAGGCVEAAICELAEEVLRTGTPALRAFGLDDSDVTGGGLLCGGAIEVYVERVEPTDLTLLRELADALDRSRPAVLATVIAGPAPGMGRRMLICGSARSGSLGSAGLDDAVAALAAAAADQGRTETADVCVTGTVAANPDGLGGQACVFVQAFAPAARMYIFGAVEFAAALSTVGRFLGYRVTVCDARAVFATSRRFPDADEVVVDWPHRWLESAPVDERTVICVLTHDSKFDVPLLTHALRKPAAYIGALGSRQTHQRRVTLLRQAGVSEARLARLRGPIGLDLGGLTAPQTALSIAAEIVALRHGGTGRPLADLATPIHSRVPHGSGVPLD